jgi:hypothetical protein
MKKYKVLALSVSGKGKKIFESGDTVTEENFPEGNAEALVKTGHLKRIEDESVVVKNPWGEGKQKPEAKPDKVDETSTSETTEANASESDPFDLDNLLGKKDKGGKKKNK